MANELIVVSELCELEKTSLKFKRDITQAEWMKVFKSLKTIEGCVQFWIGDALAYRQQRWGMYDDIAEEVGIDKGTLSNIKAVAEKIEKPLRNGNLSFAHHQQVAYLPPEKQEHFLQKAVDEKLSVRDLREEIKKDQRKELQQPDFPNNKYQVIYADPPWSYNDTCDDGAIQSHGAECHYPTMNIEELCNLPIEELSLNDAALFIWVTSPLLEDVFCVINSWGFEYKASFVWDKVKHNMGHYNSVRHEFLLLATRGSCTPDNMKLFDSVQSIERTHHSKKPEQFYDIIDTLYGGRKIELFARNKRNGWDAWGNEI